ncbi:DUF5776 domain-containing protein [Apilactobacillus quenuiae]|uniref:DUF5776 domain-containing protein n=1 Tax=Apilactobacillus quenuiae TaxID=2008377 RepID=UPI000D01F96C|nr:DUF5776 domain-containing protein [Apilactobacillus quenuiae]
MMYNKNEFHKSNEKKLLRKVKKQWVTVSVSMLAFGGAMAVSLYESPSHLMGVPTTVEAHADSTVNKNEQTSGAVKENNDNAQSISKNLNSNGSSNSQASSDANTTSTANTNVSSATSGSDITIDYNNASNANSDAITQSSGYSYASNASNSSSNASNGVTSASNNYSSLSGEYNTASQANAINNTLGSYGNNSYSSVSNAYVKISSAYNDATAKSSSIPNNSQAVSNANTKVQNNYNSMKDPSAGSSSSDTNHGVKYASDKTYLNSETDGYNSLTSASGAISDASNAISADSSAASAAFEDITKFTQTSAYTAYSAASNGYNGVVNSLSSGSVPSSSSFNGLSASGSIDSASYDKYLAAQAAQDAETGKWNINTTSYTPDSGAVYGQAYLGAQNAMDNGNNSAPADSATTHGFDYVQKNSIDQGTKFVNSQDQFENAITSAASSNVKNIVFTKDVTFNPGSTKNTINNFNGDLTINGQNHNVDFGGNTYNFGNYNSNVTLINFNSLTDNNASGGAPIQITSGSGNINYQDLNYNSNSFTLNNNGQISINQNAILNISTTNNDRALTNNDGHLNINDGGKINIINNHDINNSLIYMTRNSILNINGGNLTVNNNGNISPGNNNGANLIVFDPGSIITVNSGNFNIKSKGTFGSNRSLIILNNDGDSTKNPAQLNISNNGTFNLNATGLNGITSGSTMTYVPSLSIKNKGNFIITTDNSGSPTLLGAPGATINIDNPGTNVVIDNGGSGAPLLQGTLNANSVGYKIVYNDGTTIQGKPSYNVQYSAGNTVDSHNKDGSVSTGPSLSNARSLTLTASPNADFYDKVQLQKSSTAPGGYKVTGNFQLSNVDPSTTYKDIDIDVTVGGQKVSQTIPVNSPISGEIVPFSLDLPVTPNDSSRNTIQVNAGYGVSSQSQTITINPNDYIVTDSAGISNKINGSAFGSKDSNTAYNDGLIAALNDNNNGPTSDIDKANTDSYNSGFKSMTPDMKTGYTNAKNAFEKHSSEPSYDYTHDSSYTGLNGNAQSAYMNTINGYTDAATNKQTNSDNNSPIYQSANNQAIQDRNNGQSLYISGQKLQQGANSSVTGGYKDAQAGYEAALLGDGHMSDSDKKYSAQYDAGLNAGNQAQAGYSKAQNNNNPMSNNNDDLSTLGNDQAKNAYKGYADAIQAAKAGKNATISKTNDGSASDNADYVNAYNAEINKAAKQNSDGQSAFLTGNKNPQDSAAEQGVYNNAYNQTQNGFQNALNNSGYTSTNVNEQAGIRSANSDNSREAYNQAIADYYAGPSNIKPNYPDNNSVYQATINGLRGTTPRPNDATTSFYDAAQSQSAGLSAAKAEIGQIDSKGANENSISTIDISNVPAGTSNPTAYVTAYNAAVDGYKDGFTNKDNNKQNDSNNQVALNAYSTANDLGQAKAGSNAFLNSKPQDPTRSDNTNYSKGYTDAQAGYLAALNNPDVNTFGKSPEYQQGATSGKKSNASGAYNQAKTDYNSAYAKDSQDPSSVLKHKPNTDDFNSQDPAYRDTINALLDAGKTPSTSPSNHDPVYTSVNSRAIAERQQGAQAFADNNFDNTNSNPLYKQGYADAQAGYQAGLNGKVVPNDHSNLSSEYTDAITKGNSANAGYNAAVTDFNAGKTAFKTGNSSYNATMAGLIDGQSGNSDKYNHQPDAQNNPTLYNLAKNQSVGYSEATKPGSAPSLDDNKSNQAEVNAYWGAQVGANTDKVNGDNKVPSDVQTDSASYQKALKQAQDEAAQGAKQYLNDKADNKELKSTNAGSSLLAQQGYENQQAYDAGLATEKGSSVPSPYKDNSGTNASYQNGQNAAASYNKEIDGTNDGTPAANGASQGFDDAKTGNYNPNGNAKYPTNPSQASEYNAAYAKAYGDASQAAKSGAQQAIADNFSGANRKTNSPLSLSDKAFNNAYDNQVAYDKGATNQNASYPASSSEAQAYNSGKASQQLIDTAGTDVANGINKIPDDATTQAQKDAYAGAHDGYTAGIAGDNADSNIGKSTAYQMAYNQAYGNAQSARNRGSQAFFDNTKNVDLSNSAAIANVSNPYSHATNVADQAAKNAFDAQKGYATGLVSQDGHNPYDTGANPNSVASNAFNEARQASAGYAAAQGLTDPDPNAIVDSNRHPILTGNTPADQAAREAYKATASAFQDAKAGKRTNNSNQSADYQMAYNMAYNANQNAMTNGQNDALGLNGAGKQASDYTPNGLTSAQKALYNQAKKDANYGYDSVMNPGNDNASSTDKSSTAYQAAAQVANNLKSGINAATGGAKTAPNADSQAGFDAAQAAIKDATQAAQAGKYQKNGKLDLSQVPVPSDYSSSAARKAYLDVYQGTYDGYNAGLNGGSQKPNNSNIAYQAAYNAAFKQGQNDIPAPANNDNNSSVAAAGSNDLLNNATPQTNFDNPDQKAAYQKAYTETKDGLNTALQNAMQNPNGSKYYGAGYNAGQQGLTGISDAKTAVSPKANGSSAYYEGFDGYKDGIDFAKRPGKLNDKSALSGKGIIYSYAFKQAVRAEIRRQNNEGIKAGLAAAKRDKSANLRNRSAAYVRAYKKAFRKEFTRHTPRYVYNINGMYLHNSNKFSKSSRVKGYAKEPRGKAHVFKVLGVTFSKSGLPRYRVAGGYITANDSHVVDAYYRHNETKAPQKVRVIKPEGTFIYKSKQFNTNTSIKKVKKNEVIRVEKLVKVGDITRFYIGNGKYISSNKTIVERVR